MFHTRSDTNQVVQPHNDYGIICGLNLWITWQRICVSNMKNKTDSERLFCRRAVCVIYLEFLEQSHILIKNLIILHSLGQTNFCSFQEREHTVSVNEACA